MQYSNYVREKLNGKQWFIKNIHKVPNIPRHNRIPSETPFILHSVQVRMTNSTVEYLDCYIVISIVPVNHNTSNVSLHIHIHIHKVVSIVSRITGVYDSTPFVHRYLAPKRVINACFSNKEIHKKPFQWCLFLMESGRSNYNLPP